MAANTDGIAAMTKTNVYGAKYMCDNFIPLLHPTEGRIVNVGSGMGIDFIVKGGEENIKFYGNDQVTWEELEAKMKTQMS